MLDWNEEFTDLMERVSLLEVTRKIDDDARPVHVVQSRYHVVGEKAIRAREIAYELIDDNPESVWSRYPATLEKLHEALSPKVAKKYLDAVLEQNGMA